MRHIQIFSSVVIFLLLVSVAMSQIQMVKNQGSTVGSLNTDKSVRVDGDAKPKPDTDIQNNPRIVSMVPIETSPSEPPLPDNTGKTDNIDSTGNTVESFQVFEEVTPPLREGSRPKPSDNINPDNISGNNSGIPGRNKRPFFKDSEKIQDSLKALPVKFRNDIEKKLRFKDKVLMTKDTMDIIRNQMDKEANGEIKYPSLKEIKNSPKKIAAVKKILKGKLSRFAIQIDKKKCDIPDLPKKLIKRRIDTDRYAFIVFMFPEQYVHKLLESKCIVRMADNVKIRNFVHAARDDLKAEALEKIKELKLYKNINDVPDYTALKDIFESDWKAEKGKVAPYQDFITPDDPAVMSNAQDSIEANYYKAVDFVWLSDNDLFGKNDFWLKPDEFFNTGNINENPIPDKLVSDCSEQANTLVSMLRASGVPAEDVRVGIGMVDFGEQSGGHAWVEYNKDGTWIVLDPTSGPYYLDGQETERNGTSFDYWETHDYPVKEVWAYYNDEYFSDETRGNAPKKWKYMASSLFGKNIMDGVDDVTLWDALLGFIMDIFA